MRKKVRWIESLVFITLMAFLGILLSFQVKAGNEVQTATITWINEDGTILKVDEDVPYGEIPAYNMMETPSKEADEDYTYTFIGWTPDISVVTGDVTYTATYTAEAIDHLGITSFHIDDITILEKTHGYYYGMMGENAPVDPTTPYAYSLDDQPEIIHYSFEYDGEQYTGIWDYDVINNQLSSLFGDSNWAMSINSLSAQDEDHPWTAGTTYTVKACIYREMVIPVVSCTFQVTIKENLLESVQFDDLKIQQNTCGYMTSTCIDMESNTIVDYYCYDPTKADNIRVSVVYDGQTYSGRMSDVAAELQALTGAYCWPLCSTEQWFPNNWTVGNTYPIMMTLYGMEAPLNVSIVDSLNEYPSMQGYSSMQSGADVYPSAQNGVDISGYVYAVTPVTKTIDDATASSVCGVAASDLHFIQEWDITSDTYPLNVTFSVAGANYMTLYVITDSDNGWSTFNRKSGNSLTMTFSHDTHAAVYVGPCLLTSLKIDNLEIVEGTNCFQDSREDETGTRIEFYHYQPWYSRSLKVTAVYDGETYSGTKSDVEIAIGEACDVMLSIDYDDPQWNEPWGVGETHTLTVSLMGVSTSFDVTIIPAPLENFSVDDLILLEGSNGFMTSDNMVDQYFRYNFDGYVKIKITYDGIQYSGTKNDIADILYQLTGTAVYATITDDQSYEHPWVAGGQYQAKASFMGKEATFTVKIEETPFESIVAEDITIIKDVDGYSMFNDITGNSYFRYSYTPAIKLIAKNGEEISYDPSPYSAAFVYKDSVFPVIVSDDQDDNLWDVGIHQATVWCGGLETTFSVTVVDSPVESLLIDPIRAYEGVELSNNLALCFPFTVVFKDGTTQTYERRSFQYNGRTYNLTLTLPSSSSGWVAGDTYYGQVSVLGYKTEVPIKVYEIESLEVQENNGLTLLIHQTDGETVTANVRYFSSRAMSPSPSVYSSLYTDKGTFYATITNYYSGQNIQIEIAGITSNVLPTSQWMETNKHAMDTWYIGTAGNISFNGIINQYNIDGIISVARRSWLQNNGGTATANAGSYALATVKEWINDLFVVTADYDLKLSSYYNAEKDTLDLPRIGGLGGSFDCMVLSTETEQGFVVFSTYGPERDITVLFDENYKIKQFGTPSSVKTATITWVDEDGTVLEEDTDVLYGETPTYDGTTPTKEADAQYTYTFAGWTPDISPVEGDATYTATYTTTVKKYTVTFVDADGTVLKEAAEYPYGTAAADIEKPADPVKAADAQYTYTFAGWTPEITAVTADATYKATYTSTVNKYTVTFVDADGTVLKEAAEYPYGTAAAGIEKPADPVKAADAQYTYTFAGWTPEITAVTADATYKATYTSTVNKYAVTFVDADGTVLQAAAEYEYGTPAADIEKPADPVKAADAQYTYTFAGWTPAVDAVTGNVTYRANYTSTVNTYTITWKNANGTVLKTETLAYGASPSYTGQEPAKEETEDTAFRFDRWTPAVADVTGDAVYTAVFVEEPFTFPGVAADFTGLAQSSNGNWYYLKNGKKDTSCNSIIGNSAGWWYVKDGKVDFGYTGVKNNEYGWWYVKDGKVDFSYTGFASNEYGWWYVEKGQIKFDKNDILNGKANTDPTAAGEDGWWYIVKSQVTKKTTVAQNANGWWYVKDGKVDFGYTGVKGNENGWWYIHEGKVDFSYTGFASNEYGWWYVEKGQVKFDKDDILSGKANTNPEAAGEDGWWYIVKSQVTKKTTVAQNEYGWWYVKDGKVDFTYTGLAENDYGTWYIKDGKVDFSFTGTYDGEQIVKGQVQ